MTSKLVAAQWQFTRMLSMLIDKAHAMGYELTMGDAFRDPRVFGLMGERMGYGESRSAHKQRLAVDINLWLNDKLLTKTEGYSMLGLYWESIGGTWGGRFSASDGNHFSLKFNGIA